MIQWLSLALFFGILSLFFKIHLFYALFYLSIILPLLSRYLLRSVFNRLDIDISLEPRNIFYREASKFSITISNDSSLPVYW
ncbi:MAG TPA: hypothetical protein PK811_07510, partial [bacterium]|nr:hypothetical protein [bacterium]